MIKAANSLHMILNLFCLKMELMLIVNMLPAAAATFLGMPAFGANPMRTRFQHLKQLALAIAFLSFYNLGADPVARSGIGIEKRQPNHFSTALYFSSCSLTI